MLVGLTYSFFSWYFKVGFVSGSISTASGSALVRLGNTTVVCGVKAEICEPNLDNPDNGFIGTP